MEAKKSYKTFRYKNSLVWEGARRGKLMASGKADIQVASPPEFKGEPGFWCPEEMFVGSVNTCLMLTFLAFANAKNIAVVAYESSADGLLENVQGKYRVTEVVVEAKVSLKSSADLETARKIMEGVDSQCFITNSITTKVKLSPEFRVAVDP